MQAARRVLHQEHVHAFLPSGKSRKHRQTFGAHQQETSSTSRKTYAGKATLQKVQGLTRRICDMQDAFVAEHALRIEE